MMTAGEKHAIASFTVARSRMSPMVEAMPPATLAATNRLGSVAGASARPATSQPMRLSQLTSHPPVNPVWPVTKMRLPRKTISKSSKEESVVMRATSHAKPQDHRMCDTHATFVRLTRSLGGIRPHLRYHRFAAQDAFVRLRNFRPGKALEPSLAARCAELAEILGRTKAFFDLARQDSRGNPDITAVVGFGRTKPPTAGPLHNLCSVARRHGEKRRASSSRFKQDERRILDFRGEDEQVRLEKSVDYFLARQVEAKHGFLEGRPRDIGRRVRVGRRPSRGLDARGQLDHFWLRGRRRWENPFHHALQASL